MPQTPSLQALQPTSSDQSTPSMGALQTGPQQPDYGYGPRWDEASQSFSGAPKGLGFLGPLANPQGQTMSEYSLDGKINGKPTSYPSIVPTLSKEEVTAILNSKEGEKLPDSVYQKAAAHAKMRMDNGQNTFAQPGEQQNLYPELPRMPTPTRIR